MDHRSEHPALHACQQVDAATRDAVAREVNLCNATSETYFDRMGNLFSSSPRRGTVPCQYRSRGLLLSHSARNSKSCVRKAPASFLSAFRSSAGLSHTY